MLLNTNGIPWYKLDNLKRNEIFIMLELRFLFFTILSMTHRDALKALNTVHFE